MACDAAHRAMVAIEAIRANHGSNVSLHAVARGLTERQIATPRGGIWTATAVRRVLARGRDRPLARCWRSRLSHTRAA